MASIVDVAKRAGVSIATVSKVINNYPSISRKTRLKVAAAIEELNYLPNMAARGLVAKRSRLIGVFLSNLFTNPFITELLAGIEERLRHSGYDLVFLSMKPNDHHYSMLSHTRSRDVEGLIIIGIERDLPELQPLLRAEIPSVYIDTDIVGKRAGYITADSARGILLGVAHLQRLGHRRIAFITGELNNIVGRSRFEGYQQGLRAFGLPYISSYIVYGNYDRAEAEAAMAGMLELQEPPTGVICTSDLMAVGAIAAIEASGRRVPDDVSVIGFDNTHVAEMSRPRLTTVNQNLRQIGAKALSHLIGIIQDPSYAPPVAIEPVELIVRDSTARCRALEQSGA
ncbi:LacI family transcriptional regulator [Paenibacillus sp. 598K]|uniref:LacI family DNA-binding transcriptional regulator n=1 Tax=Paenibacillus sp. 598K TaxID=1117987 RepID=UPI000FF9B4D1|nr:LacI family DNA-binding transcriptional regulator [Paenibacillus sp. 598K]GBF76696.1 LacI family transcriptional regulator [Paenibacillus sp. 598K]